MGIISFFKRQLSTVIEWTDQNPNLLFYRIETPTSEVKNASKLIVSPGQACILVYEGKIESILTEQGTYVIDTDNHPFVTNLRKLRQAFESEHKMYIYFYRTAEVLNQLWGTDSPIKYLDPVYKFPIQLGAYGNYSVMINDANHLFNNVIGSRTQFTADDLRDVVIGRISPDMKSYLAQSSYSYNEIDSNLSKLSSEVKEKINQNLTDLGFTLTDFRIEATSFDEETQARIGKIADMTTEAISASEVGLDYVQLEKLRALRDAARNEGGLAGAGLQVGAGLELSKTLLQQKDEILAESSTNDDPVLQIKKLKMLLDENIITQDEFDLKKKDILNRI